jgi:hypothetical protein
MPTTRMIVKPLSDLLRYQRVMKQYLGNNPNVKSYLLSIEYQIKEIKANPLKNPAWKGGDIISYVQVSVEVIKWKTGNIDDLYDFHTFLSQTAEEIT